MTLEFSPGDRVRLTAAHDGDATDVSWRWVKPAGSSAPASTTNVLEWVTGANDAGVYDVEVTSPTAPDSPAYGAFRLDLPPAPDPDVLAYITAVEAADGQALEQAVKDAINTFVTALKATTGWAAMDSFLPMVGARTLAGAMVPLKGPAPTFQNFTSGDYNRKQGLTGDLINKGGFVTPRATAIPTNALHYSIYAKVSASDPNRVIAGRRSDTVIDIQTQIMSSNRSGIVDTISVGDSGFPVASRAQSVGFVGGASNNNSAQSETWLASGVQVYSAVTTIATEVHTYGIVAQYRNSTLQFFSASTVCCFSAGAYYNQPMAVKDAINNYLTALATAIPATRARDTNGQFIADDPTTPDVNEAWVGGAAPA